MRFGNGTTTFFHSKKVWHKVEKPFSLFVVTGWDSDGVIPYEKSGKKEYLDEFCRNTILNFHPLLTMLPPPIQSSVASFCACHSLLLISSSFFQIYMANVRLPCNA